MLLLLSCNKNIRWHHRMKQNFNIENEQSEAFHQRILKENISRVNIVAYIVLVIELFMIIRNFYNYGFTKVISIFLYSSLILACILMISINHFYKSKGNPYSKFQDVALKVFYIFTIYWGVVVSILDQFSYDMSQFI